MDIRGLIKARGYTIEDVAKKMEITRVTLSQNLSRNPTLKTLQKIADVIGCRIGDFFADEVLLDFTKAGSVTIKGEEYDVYLKKKK